MRLLKASLLVLTLSGLAAACGDAYRYPCQDPAKASTRECSCENPSAPRTKNKALNAIETQATTTTIHRLLGFDC